MDENTSFGARLARLWREIVAFFNLFWGTDLQMREIVFHAAQAQYYAFYEGLVRELIRRNSHFCYITSDANDPILTDPPSSIKPFYLDVLFPLALQFLNAKVIVMTTPDLHKYHIRRSIYDAHHIFAFHSMCSSHMGLRKGALDHFDAIFCAGPYHCEEILRTENLYKLRSKCLVETGYYRLEKVYSEHKEIKKKSRHSSQGLGLVLIAPSWHEQNILNICGKELIDRLLDAGYRVVLRPHPMTIFHKMGQLRQISDRFSVHPNFHLDTHSVSEKYFHLADVLVTDWSGIAMEYAFGTERPVLFVDLPPKIHNPEYLRIGMEPFESFLRHQIGKILKLTELHHCGQIVGDLIKNRERYREKIISLREKHLFNFGTSSVVGADHILKIHAGGKC